MARRNVSSGGDRLCVKLCKDRIMQMWRECVGMIGKM